MDGPQKWVEMDVIQVDLHLHTNSSDGALSPGELVNLCHERGLRTIAITDHDTTFGLTEAQKHASRLGIRILNGIELGSRYFDDEVHILGYGIDVDDAKFQQRLSSFRNGRLLRGKKITDKLFSMGINIPWELVVAISKGDSVGRPHIAAALVQLGHANDIRDAFIRYLNTGAPGFVPREMLSPLEAVKVLKDNGSIPVLAHPLSSDAKSGRSSIQNLDVLLPELVEEGLAGIEVYYGDYNEDQISALCKLADEYSLIKCGGSDYHNSENPNDPHPGDVGPPIETVEQIDLALSNDP